MESAMLLRCATRLFTAPVRVAAGLTLFGGIAAGVAVGAGVLGTALLARRFREERQGWRGDAPGEEPPMPEPVPNPG
jgi:hypothetical protein